ncbi:hypothetical protein Tco_0390427, partial [Tanacetum coccineum]
SENWSIRRIGTQYGVSGLLVVGSKNKIFQNFLELVWIRRIGPPGCGVSDLLDTAYRTDWVRRIELLRYDVLWSLGTAYWLFGYGELAENVLLMVFDQSIIYGVSADMDTVYSSKSGNGLEFFKVIRYGVRIKQKSQENGQKPGKHEHGNRRARKKPGGSYQSQTVVNLQSTWSTKVKKECHVGLKKAQRKWQFTLEVHSEETQGVSTTDCHAGNPCELISDPTVCEMDPMIEK